MPLPRGTGSSLEFEDDSYSSLDGELPDFTLPDGNVGFSDLDCNLAGQDPTDCAPLGSSHAGWPTASCAHRCGICTGATPPPPPLPPPSSLAPPARAPIDRQLNLPLRFRFDTSVDQFPLLIMHHKALNAMGMNPWNVKHR